MQKKFYIFLSYHCIRRRTIPFLVFETISKCEIDERLFVAIKSSILHAHVAHDTMILFYSPLLCFINKYPFQSGSRCVSNEIGQRRIEIGQLKLAMRARDDNIYL